jgi:asparagine synthase (glutamine-hydrolysing)
MLAIFARPTTGAHVARILGLNQPKVQQYWRHLEHGANFLGSYVDDELDRVRHSTSERNALLVLTRPNERPRLHYDPDSGAALAFDGAPQRGDHLLSASELFALWRARGIDRMGVELDGAYVIVIVDELTDALHILRDHLGAKPFYYAETPSGLAYGSGPGALVRSGLVDPKIEPNTVAKYAACNYKATYGRKPTFFQGIQMIPWGCRLEALDGRPPTIFRYWDMDPDAPFLAQDGPDIEQLYRDTMRDALRDCFAARTDASFCVALSGGIDSGTVVGMLHELLGRRVPAISMTYEDQTVFDETRLMRASVDAHVSDWHNIKLGWQAVADALGGLYHRFEHPLATISMFGYDFLTSQAKERGFRVLYTGSGGDYPQAGTYPALMFNLADLKARKDQSAYAREVAAWVQQHGTVAYPKTQKTAEDFFINAVDFGEPGKLTPYVHWLLNRKILDADFMAVAGDMLAYTVRPYRTYLRSYTLQGYLYESAAAASDPEDVMDWTYGTEMVSPLTRDSVLQFGWRLPAELKIQNGVNKILARRALRGVVPDLILDEVAKGGFNAPIDQWFRGPMQSMILDLFGSRAFRQRGIYQLPNFDTILREHFSGSANHMMFLWQALNLELWMREWIDRPSLASA